MMAARAARSHFERARKAWLPSSCHTGIRLKRLMNEAQGQLPTEDLPIHAKRKKHRPERAGFGETEEQKLCFGEEEENDGVEFPHDETDGAEDAALACPFWFFGEFGAGWFFEALNEV